MDFWITSKITGQDYGIEHDGTSFLWLVADGYWDWRGCCENADLPLLVGIKQQQLKPIAFK